MRRRLLRLLPLLMLVACKHVDPYIATGESLKALGQDFIAAGAAMNDLATSHAITPEQYTTWARFATKFKPSYALAVRTWTFATSEKDKQDVQDIIIDLSGQLASFTPLLVQLVGPYDGGTP